MSEFVLVLDNLLDIVNIGEVNAKRFVKLLSSPWKRFSSQLSQKVAKVIAAMEDHPFDVFIEDKP